MNQKCEQLKNTTSIFFHFVCNFFEYLMKRRKKHFYVLQTRYSLVSNEIKINLTQIKAILKFESQFIATLGNNLLFFQGFLVLLRGWNILRNKTMLLKDFTSFLKTCDLMNLFDLIWFGLLGFGCKNFTFVIPCLADNFHLVCQSGVVIFTIFNHFSEL